MARYRAIYDDQGKLAEFNDGELTWAADRFYSREERKSSHGLILDIPPWDSYESPASGKMITSRKERREDMARTNSRPWEGLASEQREAARQKQYNEQRQDTRLHEAASRAFYQLDPKKRRELTRG